MNWGVRRMTAACLKCRGCISLVLLGFPAAPRPSSGASGTTPTIWQAISPRAANPTTSPQRNPLRRYRALPNFGVSGPKDRGAVIAGWIGRVDIDVGPFHRLGLCRSRKQDRRNQQRRSDSADKRFHIKLLVRHWVAVLSHMPPPCRQQACLKTYEGLVSCPRTSAPNAA
jgi:hypothetical protein